jgi:trk system potassium uptake protein TrkA
MFVLIAGVGRVGSSLARTMLEEGHEVSCLDEDPDALLHLEAVMGGDWIDAGGSFTVGQALELDALTAAGVERADAFVASTDGDNTNLVIAQIARLQFNVPTVIARVLDPRRAEWYEQQGVRTICPTRSAIEMLSEQVRAAASGAEAGGEAPA